MKRLLVSVLACALVMGAVALSQVRQQDLNEVQVTQEAINPWTSLQMNNNPANFQFVIVTDRAGGHRARIFSQAVEQINLLQPEFVLCVGDLIEGYGKEQGAVNKMWQEFQSYVGKLKMPFFYVPGNHDFGNALMAKDWKARFGRSYYSFVYRDVLFLALNSEAGKGNCIEPEQVEFVKKTLQAHPMVRWTIVSLHRPLWDSKAVAANGWLEVEKALGQRPYTVFCGHEHRYKKSVRNGRNFYQLATTGGVSRLRGLRYGEFDHIVWVTMTNKGPVLANILLNGIYPEDLQLPETDEAGVKRSRRPTQPVKGRVFFEGKPTPNAHVAFYTVNEKTKKATRTADGLVEEDGTFTLTTYQAFDGAPVGKYTVTISWHRPPLDSPGEPELGPNRLPECYASPTTSDLQVEVVEGMNDFPFELRQQN